MSKVFSFFRLPAAALSVALVCGLTTVAPAAAQYRQKIGNDLDQCRDDGPALLVTVSGIRSSRGTLRVQSYRANAAEWLAKGRWISRIEVPAHAGTMTFCLPVPAAGSYGIAVRHDANGNGSTDFTQDGGGMSNNPSINIFNLGKPSFRQTAVAIGDRAKAIRIVMKYM